MGCRAGCTTSPTASTPALESLQAQTLEDIEIICVNDGSVPDDFRVSVTRCLGRSRFAYLRC
ncbi:MAG: glycosyltransferase [Collinsella sp.]